MLMRQFLLLVVAVASSIVYLIVSQTTRLIKVFLPWKWEGWATERMMAAATSYDEWLKAASKMDTLKGHDRWCHDPQSRAYDSVGLQCRLDELRKARYARDWDTRLRLLRENLHRNNCGIFNRTLYARAATGTKRLIEEYVDEMALQIQQLREYGRKPLRAGSRAGPELTIEMRERFLLDARQAYGRTALVFSGGVNLGMYHVGVVKTLHEQNLLPPIVCGTSIGALMSAFIGVCNDDELPMMWSSGVDGLDYSAFAERGRRRPSWARKLRRFLKHGVLMDINVLARFCEVNIGDLTFQEAFDKTGRIINITVPETKGVDGNSRLLNYITAPNVLVWTAACASCEMPVFYGAFPLRYKDEHGTIHVRDRTPTHVEGHHARHHEDLPMKRLSELFNVNQFIVSQVHPHIVPFLRPAYSSSRTSVLHKAYMLVAAEWHHRCSQLAQFGLTAGPFRWIQNELSYNSKGHIIIVPPLSLGSLSLMIRNPSEALLRRCMHESQISTYAQVASIRTRCKIETALRHAVVAVRKEVAATAAAASTTYHTQVPESPSARGNGTVDVGTRARGGEAASFWHSPARRQSRSKLAASPSSPPEATGGS
eukprot:m.1265554 g.1265554  ORF g.1265554 m.1265554 type:complete len:597 (-) comp24737_c0_seq35:3304-5094(-)